MHSKAKCLDARAPKSNTGYWGPKLARNVARDSDVRKALHRMGWRVLVVWDCETNDLERLAAKLSRFLQ